MVMPKVRSKAVSGGIRVSTMLPCTLAMKIEVEVLANAFWAIAIITRPGARNSRNGTPPTVCTARPRASEKMARNNSVVAIGPKMVWV